MTKLYEMGQGKAFVDLGFAKTSFTMPKWTPRMSEIAHGVVPGALAAGGSYYLDKDDRSPLENATVAALRGGAVGLAGYGLKRDLNKFRQSDIDTINSGLPFNEELDDVYHTLRTTAKPTANVGTRAAGTPITFSDLNFAPNYDQHDIGRGFDNTFSRFNPDHREISAIKEHILDRANRGFKEGLGGGLSSAEAMYPGVSPEAQALIDKIKATAPNLKKMQAAMHPDIAHRTGVSPEVATEAFKYVSNPKNADKFFGGGAQADEYVNIGRTVAKKHKVRRDALLQDLLKKQRGIL